MDQRKPDLRRRYAHRPGKGVIAEGQLQTIPFTVPSGTKQTTLELTWQNDWSAYPTNDLDLILVDPDGKLNFDGATLNGRERAVIKNPKPGAWRMLVDGRLLFRQQTLTRDWRLSTRRFELHCNFDLALQFRSELPRRCCLKRAFTIGTALLLLSTMNANAQQDKVESKQVKIARALSAGPAHVAKSAKVVDRDEKGNETVLREGTNGFTCFPGHPGVVGDVAYCANAPALQWEKDMAEHKSKPTNTEPGIEYMLAGGTDWSATDPYATSGTPIKEPAHWMIMWRFDPAITGLPTTPKQTGTWIMYSGTPWAHLMINQRP